VDKICGDCQLDTACRQTTLNPPKSGAASPIRLIASRQNVLVTCPPSLHCSGPDDQAIAHATTGITACLNRMITAVCPRPKVLYRLDILFQESLAMPPIPARAVPVLERFALGLVRSKLGNHGSVKYPTAVELPDDKQPLDALALAQDLGINLK